jgi:amino acid transporter
MAGSDDVALLQELGYEQELRRRLGIVGNIAIGFATISPVVALYGVMLVGTHAAGPAWVWALPVCLVGQCLLVAVYAELSARFPLSGGAYQWTRRLVGPAYAWFTGWLAICGYLTANTTIAYLAAPWVLAVAQIGPTPLRLVAVAAVFIILCSAFNILGIDVLRWVVGLGVAAEAALTIGAGLSLLLFFRTQKISVLLETLGAEARFGGSFAASFLAAMAVGGWVFIGFDACVGTSEETKDAVRRVPRALWWALLSVGFIVIANAVGVVLAHPDAAQVVAGHDLDPVTTTVVSSFGSWSAKPFAAMVLVAFFACGLAAQGLTARTIYSVARDDVLPGSRRLKRVGARRRSPNAATLVVTVAGCAGLLLGLEATAIGSLITFGTAIIYLVFLLIAFAALVARLRGRWVPAGQVRFRHFGTLVNLLAVVWLTFEFVNIMWPRAVLAPEGAPWYQIWAAPLVTAVAAAAGVGYLLLARPQDRVRRSAALAANPFPADRRESF